MIQERRAFGLHSHVKRGTEGKDKMKRMILIFFFLILQFQNLYPQWEKIFTSTYINDFIGVIAVEDSNIIIGGGWNYCNLWSSTDFGKVWTYIVSDRKLLIFKG